jgi:hypothetical protein
MCVKTFYRLSVVLMCLPLHFCQRCLLVSEGPFSHQINQEARSAVRASTVQHQTQRHEGGLALTRILFEAVKLWKPCHCPISEWP